MGIQPIRARAKDTYGAIGPWGHEEIPIGDNNPPDAPKLSGPTRVPPGTYEYTFNATDPDGDNIKYHIEWGDGNGEETEFYSSGEKITVNHTFSEIQVYFMKAQAIDPYDYSSEWATLRIEISKSRQISNLFTNRFLEQFLLLEVFLRIMNHPPDAPDIDGPVRGKPRVEYDFVFSTTDPEGDDVSYYVEWGDGTSNGWTDYYPSGADVLISHTWKKIDWDNIIRAKAKDIHGAESDWSITPVPINKITVNHLFLRFLEQFLFLEVFLRIMNLLR